MRSSSIITISILFSFVFLLGSCSKEEGLNTATINITSPAYGAAYGLGDTVYVTGTIKAAESLHGYSIYIRGKEDKVSLFAVGVHDHATDLTVDTFWVNTFVGDTTSVELELIASLDHDGNSTGKKVTFQCIP